MGIIILVSTSCSSTKCCSDALRAVQNSSEVQKVRSVDTVVIRDSVFVQDSIIYRERTILDTVYITKEVFRDALNSKFLIQNSIKTDTVVDVRVEKEVVQLPPKRYIPKFYRWCTGLLWAILVLAIGRFAIGRFAIGRLRL